MEKLILSTKRNGDMIFLATIYMKGDEIVIETESNELKRILKEVIEKAIKEGKVTKAVIKKPKMLRYLELLKDTEFCKEIYEEIPLKPNDPEFLRSLRWCWEACWRKVEKHIGSKLYVEYLKE